jgi:acetolactate decarboxylase
MNFRNPILWLVLFLSGLLSCDRGPEESSPFQVKYAGALKDIMRKGDLAARIDLSDFHQAEHIYALGAVENLKGEILILDSKPLISTAQGGKLLVRETLEAQAALLVYTSVDRWRSFRVPDSVDTYSRLEAHIEQVALNNGLSRDEPFPFLLVGGMQKIDWHVIDWATGDTEHSHEKHKSSGPHGTLTGPAVTILGFFSRHHQGIFTHHTTYLHMHFVLKDRSLAGHVDDLVPQPGLVLKLPYIQ